MLGPADVTSWAAATAACLELCRTCARCRYLTVSPRFRDCSWYQSCPARFREIDGFRSGALDGRQLDVTNASASEAAKDLLLAEQNDIERARAQRRSARLQLALEQELSRAPGARRRRRDTGDESSHGGGGGGGDGGGGGTTPFFVLGILCPPAAFDRRAFTRPSFRWQADRQRGAFAYQYVLGSRIRPAAAGLLDALRSENGSEGDLLMLPRVRDGMKDHLAEKTLSWFLHAASVWRTAEFLGKCDIDTFVVVPRAMAFFLHARTMYGRKPLLLGRHQWASFSLKTKEVCGCCGYTATMGRAVQRRTGTAPFSCLGVPGPIEMHPFGIGMFFAISSELGEWMRTSHEARRSLSGLLNGGFGSFANYAEELFFGRLASHAPDFTSVSLGFAGRAVHDIDDKELLDGECMRKLGLSVHSLQTGHVSSLGKLPEKTAPNSVAVHHVLDALAWNRTFAATTAWTRWLRTRGPGRNANRNRTSCLFQIESLKS